MINFTAFSSKPYKPKNKLIHAWSMISIEKAAEKFSTKKSTQLRNVEMAQVTVR